MNVYMITFEIIFYVHEYFLYTFHCGNMVLQLYWTLMSFIVHILEMILFQECLNLLIRIYSGNFFKEKLYTNYKIVEIWHVCLC